jgi:general L-amino acid transport system substrate-binding protein
MICCPCSCLFVSIHYLDSLLCPPESLPSFFALNIYHYDIIGFDVDFCRALSAAIFDGVTNTVVYLDLPASVRFEELQAGSIDVLSRLTTVTLSRDVNEPSTGVGFQFSQPNFYDGLTFGGIPP